MPHTYKRKPGSKPYTVTPEATLQQAHKRIRNGTSQRDVCKDFGLTRSVLQRYLKKMDAGEEHRAPGGQTVLSLELEQSIVRHLSHLSDWGFPFNFLDLRMAVKRILDRERRNIPFFQDNCRGKEWVRGFMTRHKDVIRQKLCQNISKKRAAVSKQVVTDYFSELQKSLKDVPPIHIVNYDETNLTDDPGRRKMIFKRGVRYPERIINSTKSSTSLMLVGTASGTVLPLYVVYKAENLWSTWTGGGPKGCRFNRSKSGWFDHICFNDWFHTVALPYCSRLEGKKVLIGDNLSSHFNYDILKARERNNIAFICLPANATHLLQPLDVAFFGPMKTRWRSVLIEYKLSKAKNAGIIPKDVFPKLLKKLMDDLPNQSAKAGFEKCGIHPLCAEPVLRRLPSENTEDLQSQSQLNTSISEAFTSQLRELRCGNDSGPAKRARKKKVNVVPGRSIAAEDAAQCEWPGPSNHVPVPVVEEENENEVDGPDSGGYLNSTGIVLPYLVPTIYRGIPSEIFLLHSSHSQAQGCQAMNPIGLNPSSSLSPPCSFPFYAPSPVPVPYH
ncbi:hypothetical protein RRG08_007247 [Elysia crispata]|uniref:DDE-1 domain-containing protein n=1 Tax=Elysia crispata TaxID=231223 RepID=A0AAE0ZT70_9GAST|nr:hypothetical protein RRG08_007247 [Elysia crispata]